MTSTRAVLCPKCQHPRGVQHGTTVINGTHVAMISCFQCGYTWAMVIPPATPPAMPDDD